MMNTGKSGGRVSHEKITGSRYMEAVSYTHLDVYKRQDYDTVYHVVKEAFENAEYTDGNEQHLKAKMQMKNMLL